MLELHFDSSVKNWPDQIALDGKFDLDKEIEYWGIATHVGGGKYRCMANVCGVLCALELQAKCDRFSYYCPVEIPY